MSQAQLAQLIDNVDTSYYETGANYDTDYDAYQMCHFEALEEEHNLSII